MIPICVKLFFLCPSATPQILCTKKLVYLCIGVFWGVGLCEVFFFFFCVLKFLCDLKAGDALGTEVRGISVRRNWTPATGSLIWCAHFDYWTYFVSLVYTVVISESVLMLCLLWVMLIWQVWCCIFLRLKRSRYAFQVLVVMLLPFYF